MRATATAAHTSGIQPDVLYTLSGFIRESGISRTRMTEARAAGIDVPKLVVGKRAFIKGQQGIEFIELLAERDRVMREGVACRPVELQ